MTRLGRKATDTDAKGDFPRGKRGKRVSVGGSERTKSYAGFPGNFGDRPEFQNKRMTISRLRVLKDKAGLVKVLASSDPGLGHALVNMKRLSRRTGRPHEIVVRALPSGMLSYHVVGAVDRRPAAPDEAPARAESSRTLADALADARLRGDAAIARILEGEDMLSADALAQRLAVSRETINTWRHKKRLLALRGPKRGYRFPLWQLDETGQPRPGIAALIEVLGDEWAVYRFLVQSHGALDGLTGRAALERGLVDEAIAAAHGIAQGDFT